MKNTVIKFKNFEIKVKNAKEAQEWIDMIYKNKEKIMEIINFFKDEEAKFIEDSIDKASRLNEKAKMNNINIEVETRIPHKSLKERFEDYPKDIHEKYLKEAAEREKEDREEAKKYFESCLLATPEDGEEDKKKDGLKDPSKKNIKKAAKTAFKAYEQSLSKADK